MLVGGFYSIDLQLLQQEPTQTDFPLRCDTEHHFNRKVFTNNGRTATVYALENALALTGEDTILVPDYLCVSVLNALETTKAKFRFYRIRADLTADVEDMKSKMDASVKVIYIIHYFGIPQPIEVAQTTLSLKDQYGAAIVEDLTQTLYTSCPGRMGYGDLLVASTRKWLPVTDGGVMAVRDGLPCTMAPLQSAYDKAVYQQLLITVLRQYYDEHPEADISYYLQMEKEANAARYLDFTPREMTDQTKRILFQFDHSRSMEKRRENYTYLYNHLSDLEGVGQMAKPLDPDGAFIPFGFPLLVENRAACYDYLTCRGVIPEIQWVLPTQYYDPGADARYLSDHNIMLQCDQRYGVAEMEQMVQAIKDYFGGAK